MFEFFSHFDVLWLEREDGIERAKRFLCLREIQMTLSLFGAKVLVSEWLR